MKLKAPMGKVIVKIKLTNVKDVFLTEAGDCREKPRTVEVQAVVDTGATRLCLKPSVLRKLGLPPLLLDRGEGWGEESLSHLPGVVPLQGKGGLEPLGIRATWEGARRICQTAKAARPTERARRSQRRQVCTSRERQIHKYGKRFARAGAPFGEAESPLWAEPAGASESLRRARGRGGHRSRKPCRTALSQVGNDTVILPRKNDVENRQIRKQRPEPGAHGFGLSSLESLSAFDIRNSELADDLPSAFPLVPLEVLDFVVEAKGQKLIPNPAPRRRTDDGGILKSAISNLPSSQAWRASHVERAPQRENRAAARPT